MTYWLKEETKETSINFPVRSRKSRYEDPRQNAIKVLTADIKAFYLVNKNLSASEATQAFRGKWAGYNKDYTESFIEVIFRGLEFV